MKSAIIWKYSLAAIFLLAITCLAIQPALAADKSKKKDNPNVADTVDQTLPQDQLSAEQLAILEQGPWENPGPGTYTKTVKGNDKVLTKEFKNGHPENNSGWVYGQ